MGRNRSWRAAAARTARRSPAGQGPRLDGARPDRARLDGSPAGQGPAGREPGRTGPGWTGARPDRARLDGSPAGREPGWTGARLDGSPAGRSPAGREPGWTGARLDGSPAGREPGQGVSAEGCMSLRAASVRLPDSDGYTANVCAIWSTVSRCSTASDTARISSLARGATTTPPSTTPVPGRAKSLMNPSLKPAIFARALVASGSFTTRAATSPASTAWCVTPTVAISGSVKMVAATWLSLIGWTASPSACHIAIRPNAR